MSDAFVELTSKNLHPTRAHMVIFTNDALPEDTLSDKLQPIFGIQWLQEVFNSPSPSSSPLKNHHPRRPSAHRVRNPTVRIVIMSDDPSSSDQQQRQCNLNNTENGSTSSSSSFCYQIPFRFKGFHHHHCQSKQAS
jgi:hypothetical protein